MLPKGWKNVKGRVTAPTKTGAGKPQSADPMPPEKAPEKDPNKEPSPAAAAPQKCAKCEAEIAIEPPAKFCPQCGEPLDGGQSAPAEGEPAKAMALGRHVLALTGATSPDAARGILAAWKESSGKAEQLVEAQGRLDVLERERLLERAVAEERLDPSEAWAFTEKDGKKVRSFSDWAGPPNAAKGTGQPLAQLKAFIEHRGTGSRKQAASKPMTPAAPAAPVAPPPRGINPDAYAAASRQIAEMTGGKS